MAHAILPSLQRDTLKAAAAAGLNPTKLKWKKTADGGDVLSIIDTDFQIWRDTSGNMGDGFFEAVLFRPGDIGMTASAEILEDEKPGDVLIEAATAWAKFALREMDAMNDIEMMQAQAQANQFLLDQPPNLDADEAFTLSEMAAMRKQLAEALATIEATKRWSAAQIAHLKKKIAELERSMEFLSKSSWHDHAMGAIAAALAATFINRENAAMLVTLLWPK